MTPTHPHPELHALASRRVTGERADELSTRLQAALAAEPARADRITALLTAARARAPRLLAGLGLALVTTGVVLAPAEASDRIPASAQPASTSTAGTAAEPSRAGHPRTGRLVTISATRPEPPAREPVSELAIDVADELAGLAEMLGHPPARVSVDDLERFIRASFATASSTPYRSDDPDRDPLDRGVALPVTGTRSVSTALTGFRRHLASQPDPDWSSLPGTAANPLEQQAWQSFEDGDMANFRFLLFGAIETTTELNERMFVLALTVSLDEYDEQLRQSWLDRIQAWRDGGTLPTAAPDGRAALAEYATLNDGPTRSAAAARLLDAYLHRVLATEQARRDREHAAWVDPRAPKTVRIAAHRQPTPSPGRHPGSASHRQQPPSPLVP